MMITIKEQSMADKELDRKTVRELLDVLSRDITSRHIEQADGIFRR